MHPIYTFAQNFIDEYHDEVHRMLQHRLRVDDGPVFGEESEDKETMVVGIVGGGVGGLFAAMLLQHCGIHYEIFEASGRTGGRLYTYRFPDIPEEDFAYYVSCYHLSPLQRLTIYYPGCRGNALSQY